MSGRWATLRALLAPESEVVRWALVALVIAVAMLAGVWVSAMLWPSDRWSGQHSLLFRADHGLDDVARVFGRNMLVLSIHFLACYIGAIIGRPRRPAPAQGWAAGLLGREVPAWAARGALLYALSATLLSVVVQATGLGLVLKDVAAASGLTPATVLALTLPHAVPELVGVFLPLGLFLIVARRGQLSKLTIWSWQSLVIAVPTVFGAAIVEAFVTPQLIRAVAGV